MLRQVITVMAAVTLLFCGVTVASCLVWGTDPPTALYPAILLAGVVLIAYEKRKR